MSMVIYGCIRDPGITYCGCRIRIQRKKAPHLGSGSANCLLLQVYKNRLVFYCSYCLLFLSALGVMVTYDTVCYEMRGSIVAGG
jgi:hypothetical protein